MNPNILLCDEATSALDPKTSKSIINLLNQINDEFGLTIIMVTHQMSIVRSTFDEISILENGRVETKGSVEQVFFTKDNLSDSIISKMSRELNIDCIIMGGEMESYKNTSLGSIIINVPIKKFDLIKNTLKTIMLYGNILNQKIEFQRRMVNYV